MRLQVIVSKLASTTNTFSIEPRSLFFSFGSLKIQQETWISWEDILEKQKTLLFQFDTQQKFRRNDFTFSKTDEELWSFATSDVNNHMKHFTGFSNSFWKDWSKRK